jgi:hypothetical protein
MLVIWLNFRSVNLTDNLEKSGLALGAQIYKNFKFFFPAHLKIAITFHSKPNATPLNPL